MRRGKEKKKDIHRQAAELCLCPEICDGDFIPRAVEEDGGHEGATEERRTGAGKTEHVVTWRLSLIASWLGRGCRLWPFRSATFASYNMLHSPAFVSYPLLSLFFSYPHFPSSTTASLPSTSFWGKFKPKQKDDPRPPAQMALQTQRHLTLIFGDLETVQKV